jgi:hypothetical protein
MNAATDPDSQNCVLFGCDFAVKEHVGQTRSAILLAKNRTKVSGSVRVGKYQKRSKTITAHKINHGEIAWFVIKLMILSID